MARRRRPRRPAAGTPEKLTRGAGAADRPAAPRAGATARRSPWPALLLVAAVYVGTAAWLPGGFWVVDNANKFLQLGSILDSGFASYSLDWAGAADDPGLRYNPVPPPFSAVVDGELYSIFSPVFPALAAIPYRLLGRAGLHLLPLAGALLLLLGVARLAEDAGLGDRARDLAILLAGLATPLWFYASVFWEHAPAAALGVWAVRYGLRYLADPSARRLLLACALAAAAVWLRDEMYGFAGLLLGYLVLRSPGRRARAAALGGACLAAGWLPLWAFQAWALGSPLGFHLGLHVGSSEGLAGHLADRPRVLYNLFAAAHPATVTSLLIVAPFAVAWALPPGHARRAGGTAVIALGLAGGLGFAMTMRGYVADGSPIAWLLQSNGLFAACPLLLLALFRGVRAARVPDGGAGPGTAPADPLRELGWLCLGWAGLYGLAAPLVGSSGIHWGNRFLLLLYPLLTLLAAANLEAWWPAVRSSAARGIVVSLVGASVLAQGVSIHLLERKREFSVRLNETLSASPDRIIITNLWWVPQELYSLFRQRPVFYIQSRADLDGLLASLRRHAGQPFVFATQSDSPLPPGATTLPDNGLDFYSLTLLRAPIP